ncbi:hypothetical protein [Xanthomonas graminis]|uniref:hypothetical protein n=1 Tax=Xanthomonas graminis TaxID=3390026 RepID=UPI0012DAC4AD|nr:hypothetical protein [Xanthomonas translucens]
MGRNRPDQAVERVDLIDSHAVDKAKSGHIIHPLAGAEGVEQMRFVSNVVQRSR